MSMSWRWWERNSSTLCCHLLYDVLQVAGSLLATLRQLQHCNQLLLIPLTMYSGFEQAAFSAEWSRVSLVCVYIVCLWAQVQPFNQDCWTVLLLSKIQNLTRLWLWVRFLQSCIWTIYGIYGIRKSIWAKQWQCFRKAPSVHVHIFPGDQCQSVGLSKANNSGIWKLLRWALSS